MNEIDDRLPEQLLAVVQSTISPLDASDVRAIARGRRRRTRAVAAAGFALALVVAVTVLLVRRPTDSSTEIATRGSTRSDQRATTSSTELQISGGISLSFSTSTDSPDLDVIRSRLAQTNADDVAHGQAPSPPDCMPQEVFTGSITVAGTSYPIGGWAPIKSGVPIRVLEYGENQDFVYVIARTYDDSLSNPSAEMTHPNVSGPMVALGDHWFIFASAVGTPAPWYTAGKLTADAGSGSTVTEDVPETNRQSRC
jgi:hypothetical protein